MYYVHKKSNKLAMIHKQFELRFGQTISAYEMPQHWCDEEKEWSDWMDLPLILIIDDKPLSISWTGLEELSIEIGRTLPFSLVESTVTWASEGHKILDSIVGQEIKAVTLGRGEMSCEGKDIEIWTQLLIQLSDGRTFNVFNALDENGFEITP